MSKLTRFIPRDCRFLVDDDRCLHRMGVYHWCIWRFALDVLITCGEYNPDGLTFEAQADAPLAAPAPLTDQGLPPAETDQARSLAEAHWTGHEAQMVAAAIAVGEAIEKGDPEVITVAAINLVGLDFVDALVHGIKHGKATNPSK